MRAVYLRLIMAVILATAVGVVASAVALAQPAYEFRLGFRTLADRIPSEAGQPLENEHWGANGDSLQQTTTGLMVWRKADNWTAFTNGSRTWVNGPEGLQERSNNQRFNWERAASVDGTAVITFRPAGIRGPDQEGYCWTESLSSGQPSAWRCMAGNRIYDPCFAIQGESGSVVCGASPIGDQYGFRLKLTQPLPERRPAVAVVRPWMLELANGVNCGFMTGATRGYEGERINYGCTDGWYILGEPLSGQPWTARQVLPSADGSTLAESVEVSVATAWR